MVGRIKDLNHLNEILKNSFQGIKRDMGQLKQSQEVQLNTFNDFRRTIDDLKKDFVTNDKFNVLKIKIGDINEEIKRLDRIEQAIGQLDDITSKKDSTKKELDSIRKEMAVLDRLTKNTITLPHLKKVVKEVNSAFDDVRRDMDNVESIGGKVVDYRIEKFKQQFNQRVIELKSKVAEYRNENAKFVKSTQVQNLLKDINKEFDGVKQEIDGDSEKIVLLNKDLKRVKKGYVKRKEFEEKVEDLNDGIQEILEEVKSSKNGNNKEIKKQLKKLSRKTKKRPKTHTFGNVMIVLAFLSLGGSILSFFAKSTQVMNIFIFVAIILFAVGIICRLIAALK